MHEDGVFYRVVFIGSTSVGKSSIISRVSSGLFNEHEPTTYGAAFVVHKVKVKDTVVNLQIWDTAGQERYRALGPIYYRAADVGVIVLSVIDQKSVDEVKDWYEQFTSISGTNTTVVIVANKRDLDSTVNMDSLNQWAREMNLLILSTSALNGFGVNDLFKHIAEVILERGEQPKSLNDGTLSETSFAETPEEVTTNRCC